MDIRLMRRLWTGMAVGALALAGCLPEGVRVPQSPLLRAFERKAGLIVYIGADGNVYTLNQAGEKKTQVTSDAVLTGGGTTRYYDFPVWSPDGERIAFVGVARSPSSEAIETKLYTARKDGRDLVEAYSSAEHFPFYLYWSPDGETVSFLATAAGGQNLVLQTVPAGGGEARMLDAGQPYYWSWAPSGDSMVVHVGGARASRPDARLAFLRINERIEEHGIDLKPTNFQAPAFSPDGEWLLFAAETDDGKNALMLADSAGQVDRVITAYDAEGSIAFAWSPNSQRLAYIASDRQRLGTLGRLTLVDLGSPEAATTLEAENVWAFFWAPDGEQLAYLVPEVVSAPTPEGGGDSSGEALLLRLSVTNAKGQSHRVADFFPTQDFVNVLPYFDQYHRSTTIWSPDSQNLVLSAYGAQGSPGIFIVGSSGGLEPRYLTDGILAFWSWR